MCMCMWGGVCAYACAIGAYRREVGRQDARLAPLINLLAHGRVEAGDRCSGACRGSGAWACGGHVRRGGAFSGVEHGRGCGGNRHVRDALVDHRLDGDALESQAVRLVPSVGKYVRTSVSESVGRLMSK